MSLDGFDAENSSLPPHPRRSRIVDKPTTPHARSEVVTISS
jgi:hypothetical protein